MAFLKALENILECADQIEDGNFGERRGFVGGGRWSVGLMGKAAFLFDGTQAQKSRRILEFLVLDQLPDQVPSRVVFLGVGFRGLLGARQQCAAFQVHEIGRHDDKLGGQVDVEQFEGVDVIEILAGNALNGNGLDVHLILFDQVKKQIQRTFKYFKAYFVVSCVHVRGGKAKHPLVRDESAEGEFLLASTGKLGVTRGAADKRPPMASDPSNNFNERLSQWVASQGFWFQMRYSMSGVGSKSAWRFHLLRLVSRFLAVLVIVAIGSAVYLLRLSGTPGYQKHLQESIAAGLGASEVQMGGFQVVQGKMLMARLASKGGNKTFYSSLEAHNIRCQMRLLSGLIGDWKPGVLLINQLDLELNAGADDEASAGLMGDSVFRDFGKFKVETVEVKDGTLRWGYSERTHGKIVGSHIKLQRVADGWRVHLSGGSMSLGWWRRMDIVEIVANCTRQGIVFEKAELRKGAGRISMDGLQVVAGQRPELKGLLKVRKLTIEDVLPPAARNFIDGAISGEFRVFGSTNTTEGIGFEGKLVADGDHIIRLRERLHLLRALTDFDVFNNYRMVPFNEGSLKIKTQGGVLDISDVNLKAGDLMTLAGQMRVRPPTPAETSATLRGVGAGNAAAGVGQPRNEKLSKETAEDLEITLRRAARAARKDKGGGAKADEGSSLFDRIDQNFEASILAEQAAERDSRSLIYEGQFQITLMPDTFENVQALREMLPVDPQTGRIPLDVPIKGDIYSITFDQAQDLYLRGQRYPDAPAASDAAPTDAPPR